MSKGFLAAIFVLLLAAAGCVSHDKPPTPHISGPDSAYVGDTVVFTATYNRDVPKGDGRWVNWSWGESTYYDWSDVYTGWHVYRRTGTFIVTLIVGYFTTDFLDQLDSHPSDRSNACTIRILASP